MGKVMVFGSFDVLHDGHRSLFRQARLHGDHLIVVVSRDVTYESLRKRVPHHHEYERLRSVADESLVDEAVLGDTKDVYRVLRLHRPSTVALGYDQEAFIDGLRERLDRFGLERTRIVRLRAFNPETLKSSLLKKS